MFKLHPEYLRAGEIAEVMTVGGNAREVQVSTVKVLTSHVVRLTLHDDSIVDVMRLTPVTVFRTAY